MACLADGRQPAFAKIAEVGYLMRTTAVYGNGKFGIGDFEAVRAGGVFSLPFQAEMLTVYLARLLSFDLVEHIARARLRTERSHWSRGWRAVSASATRPGSGWRRFSSPTQGSSIGGSMHASSGLRGCGRSGTRSPNA